MVTMAKAFGLGKDTGIDLPAESSGRIADRAWKKAYWEKMKGVWCKGDKTKSAYVQQIYRENCADYWQFRAGDAVNFAIGQGETVTTPLQMARVYSAIANGGTLWKPQIAKAVVSPSGKVVKEFKPIATGRVPVSAGTLSYIRNALAQVPVAGTAVTPFLGFPLDKIPVGAKTGTGEVFGKQTTSWFSTFAPANRPQYAVVMMVSQGGTGGGTGGPSVRKIYDALFGVNGGTINPRAAVLGGNAPPAVLPKIRPDGTLVSPAAYLPDRLGGAGAAAPLPGGPRPSR